MSRISVSQLTEAATSFYPVYAFPAPVALNFHAPYVMFLNGRSSARQQGSAPRQTGLQPLWTDAPAVIALVSGQYPGDGMNAYDIVSEQCAAWGQLRNRTTPWQISGDAAHPVMLFPGLIIVRHTVRSGERACLHA